MLYPKVNLEEWIKTYELRTDPVPCPKCQHPLELNIPIAMKGYRGIEASPCRACREDTGVFRVVPVGKDEVAAWMSLGSIFGFKK